MSRHSYRLALLSALLAIPALASGAVPVAPVGTPLPTQLFIAPSGEPFRAGPDEAYPVSAWFAAADRDRDGKLTMGEFITDAARFFDTLDLDHDQRLSGDEIKHYENDIAPEVRTGDFSEIDWNADDTPTHRGRRPALGLLQVQTDDLQAHVPELWRRKRQDYANGAGKYGIINIPEPVIAMDSDLNGIVTSNEMRSAAQRRFKLLDTEERNYLTLADLPETYAQRHGKTRKR